VEETALHEQGFLFWRRPKMRMTTIGCEGES
jgi:hypothetical protein